MATQQLLNENMEAILHSYGGFLDLPLPSHPKQWGASITKWLQRGLSAKFIEHVATHIENQEWDLSRRTRAETLEWEFGMEAHWRERMEEILHGMKYSIVFEASGSQNWEASVMECYKVGFNVGFVEELEHRQKPHGSWTAAIRSRAKSLEWEFHRPTLITKYTEGAGKATRTVVREILREKGVKLSPETLNKRLSEWGVCKRTNGHAYSSTQEEAFSVPAPIDLTASRTVNGSLGNQPYFLHQKVPRASSMQPSNMNYEALDGSKEEPVNGVQFSAISSHGESQNFANGYQNMVGAWHESSADLLGDLSRSPSSAACIEYKDYFYPDETTTGSEAMIQDLNIAIKSKEEELMNIKSNHSILARELNELKSQLKLLSLDPSRFTSSNGYQPSSRSF